jgi:hypothetical protein
MKEYSITMKLEIETNNNINIDDIDIFSEELSDIIKAQSSKSIRVINVDIEDIEDLNEDDLYSLDDEELD